MTVPAPRSAIALSVALGALTVALVGLSLRREPVQEYAVTATEADGEAHGLVGPRRVTLDASDSDVWVRFDFSRGGVVGGGSDWDVAFRRFNVLVNGGASYPGDAAVVALEDAAFDEVARAPAEGWVQAGGGRDSANPAIARWYDYGFVSHRLTPRPVTYVLRTAEGRFAKLRFLSYYCPGAAPGCITFEYVYQGDGTRSLGGGRPTAGNGPGLAPEEVDTGANAPDPR